MMKIAHINKLALIVGIFVTGLVVFSGCSVDHSLDPYKYGKVYMPQARNNPNEELVKLTGSQAMDNDSLLTVIYGAAYGGPKGRDDIIHVAFHVDPAMVDSFNINNLTSYKMLPDKYFTLGSKKAVIPVGENNTPPLRLKIKTQNFNEESQYLLPITVEVKSGGIEVNKNLKTTYYLITTVGVQIIAENHEYTAVLSDDPLDPKNLYFFGYPENSTEELVWKYNLSGDSLVWDEPKEVTDVFPNPYPKKMPSIDAAGWFRFSKDQPDAKIYFWSNETKHYYTIDDIFGNNVGSLHKFSDFGNGGWPSNFPKSVDACVYLPRDRGINRAYLFSGKYFKRMWPGGNWTSKNQKWVLYGRSESHRRADRWYGFPKAFGQRGTSGAYYDDDTETIHVFSGNEYVVFDVSRAPKKFYVKGNGPQKIADTYRGL